MNISTKDMVSNSEMIKNYKTCREKAEICGRLFILKNNQPDAVLFSIPEYEKLSEIIEYMESLDEKDFAQVMETLMIANSSFQSMTSKNEIKFSIGKR